MSHTIKQIKERCPRFRILVIGRRNAGKTTILKKMCNSDGSDLRIVDRYGNKVDPSILEPDRQRGMSDIENEITFKSNPLFVFHDSRGIEAGAEHDENSPLCTDSLWEFLDKRSREPRIRDQIHAVWMCIPMDNPRAPSSEFELAFFNARASPV
ncbi:GTP-binding protein [Mycena venus]|uniref:GTP-binding protein n=1 Tax=Mycena venus TaxID=2733690 RepID=A0A8H6YXQ6_9AGAR|nr:GTP-binding protein [Mycena venus]